MVLTLWAGVAMTLSILTGFLGNSERPESEARLVRVIFGILVAVFTTLLAAMIFGIISSPRFMFEEM